MATISTTARPAYVYDAVGDQWVPIAWRVLPAGVGSAPALTFTGDGNTGLWSPAADTVAFSTGGVERVRVDSSGNVGIGISTPIRNLHIYGNANARVRVEGDDTTDLVLRRASTDGTSPRQYFDKARGTIALSSAVVAADVFGQIYFRGHDGTTFLTGALLSAESDGTPGTNDMPGRLVFSTTADGAASPTERMRIDNAGRVGIGVTNPTHLLHVVGTGGTSPATQTSEGMLYLQDVGAGVGNGGGITFGACQGSFAQIKGYLTDGSSNTRGWLSVGLRSIPTDAGLTERIRVEGDGLITGTGTSLGAWTSYTPTLGGTGWALGNGTAAGRYCQIGKIVHFRAIITFGSTSTFGAAAAATLTLPVTHTSTVFSSLPIFTATFVDQGTGFYQGIARATSTTALTISSLGANGVETGSSATSPFTWANTDIIFVYGSYEAD